MICERCHVIMKSGTRYDNNQDRKNGRRFIECPRCHDRKYNNSVNLQEFLTISFPKK